MRKFAIKDNILTEIFIIQKHDFNIFKKFVRKFATENNILRKIFMIQKHDFNIFKKFMLKVKKIVKKIDIENWYQEQKKWHYWKKRKRMTIKHDIFLRKYKKISEKYQKMLGG